MKIDLEKFICSLIENKSSALNDIAIIDICNALSDQGLEYRDGVIVEIEPKQRPLVETEYDPYSLPVWNESNLPRMDESKYHPCTEKKDKPETEEMAYFKKAIADIVDYSRKHPDITPDGFVDRFMEHILDIASLALNEEKSNQKQDVSIQINPSEYINDMGGNGCYLKNTTQASTWSEEDEINLGKAIWYVENPAPMVAKNAMLVEWLKNLRGRVQPQHKQEWCEEDENRLSDAVFFVREYQVPTRDKRLLNAAKEAEEWLKSLRPQIDVTDEELAQAKKEAYNDALDKNEYHSGEPTFDDGWSAAIWYLKKKNARPQSSWKPSDEQLHGLDVAITTLRCQHNVVIKSLDSLYIDLKKLKQQSYESK